MLDIRTRIRTDLNPSKRIRFRIRSENMHTIFISAYAPSVLLRKNRRITRDQLRYSQIIGSLMYLACATRPDISFVVCKLSRFVSNPGDDHWRALERVMRYLKCTMSYGIRYIGHTKVLEDYCDAN